MAGALRKLTSLPVVPVVTGGAGVYTVCEQDLMRVIGLLASAATLEPGTISVAHASRVTLVDLLRTFAAQEDERTSKMLVSKTVLRDPVVCRYYCDVRGQPSWLILRRMADRWILSAMVSETLAERN